MSSTTWKSVANFGTVVNTSVVVETRPQISDALDYFDKDGRSFFTIFDENTGAELEVATIAYSKVLTSNLDDTAIQAIATTPLDEQWTFPTDAEAELIRFFFEADPSAISSVTGDFTPSGTTSLVYYDGGYEGFDISSSSVDGAIAGSTTPAGAVDVVALLVRPAQFHKVGVATYPVCTTPNHSLSVSDGITHNDVAGQTFWQYTTGSGNTFDVMGIDTSTSASGIYGKVNPSYSEMLTFETENQNSWRMASPQELIDVHSVLASDSSLFNALNSRSDGTWDSIKPSAVAGTSGAEKWTIASVASDDIVEEVECAFYDSVGDDWNVRQLSYRFDVTDGTVASFYGNVSQTDFSAWKKTIHLVVREANRSRSSYPNGYVAKTAEYDFYTVTNLLGDGVQYDVMYASSSEGFNGLSNASYTTVESYSTASPDSWRFATKTEMEAIINFIDDNNGKLAGFNALNNISYAADVAATDVLRKLIIREEADSSKQWHISVDTENGFSTGIVLSTLTPSRTSDGIHSPLLVRSHASSEPLIHKTSTWTKTDNDIDVAGDQWTISGSVDTSVDVDHFTVTQSDGSVLQIMSPYSSDNLVTANGTTSFEDIDSWLSANPLYGWRYATQQEMTDLLTFIDGNVSAFHSLVEVWSPKTEGNQWSLRIPTTDVGANGSYKSYGVTITDAAVGNPGLSGDGFNVIVEGAAALLVRDTPLDENFGLFGDITAGEVVINMAINGADSNNGSTGNPLATVIAAKQAVRMMLGDSDHADKQVVVEFAAGDYSIDSSLVFNVLDSGSATKPVIYRAADGADVRFLGGTSISKDDFVTLADGTFKTNLVDQTTAPSAILEYDLSALETQTGKSLNELLGNMEHHGFSLERASGVAPAMLYVGDDRMRLARWPNHNSTAETTSYIESGLTPSDFVGQVSMYDVEGDISGFNTECGSIFTSFSKCETTDNNGAVTNRVASKDDLDGNGGTFYVEFDRVSNWSNPSEIFIDGVVSRSWEWTYNQITTIEDTGIDNDNSNNLFKVSLQRGELSGVLEDKSSHFFFDNVAEELDQAGEFYIDRTAKKLYLYPTEAFTNGESIVLSTLAGPMFDLNGATNIVFDGIKLDGGRSRGIDASNVDNFVIKNCKIQNFSYDGIVIDGSNNKVENCTVQNLGAMGIEVTGGESAEFDNSDNLTSANLVNANNQVLNNHIENVGWDQRSQQPGVKVSGVGNTVSGNYITNTSHFALMVQKGANTLFVNNFIEALPTYFKKDGGAIYFDTGKHPHLRGNIVRGNYLKDIPTNGVYVDNYSSGLLIEDNIFNTVAIQGDSFAAININGGGDNVMQNNAFYDVERPVKYNHFARKNVLSDYMPSITKVHTAFNNPNGLDVSAYTANTGFTAFLARANTGTQNATDELVYQPSEAKLNVTFNENATTQVEAVDNKGVWAPEFERYDATQASDYETKIDGSWVDSSQYPNHGLWDVQGNILFSVLSNSDYDITTDWSDISAVLSLISSDADWSTTLATKTSTLNTTISNITAELVLDVDLDGWYDNQDINDNDATENYAEGVDRDFIDYDGDGLADEGGLLPDNDDDNDGIDDTADAWELDATRHTDTDNDGIPDDLWTWSATAFESVLKLATDQTGADADDDNDGIDDVYEDQLLSYSSKDPNQVPADFDSDGIPDDLDSDVDGDGIDNASDAFTTNPFEQTDNDSDGIGANADIDESDSARSFDTDSDTVADTDDRSHGMNLVTEARFEDQVISSSWDSNPAGLINKVVADFDKQSFVLEVSNRSATWQSARYKIDGSIISSGKTYTLRADVKTGDSAGDTDETINIAYSFKVASINSDGDTIYSHLTSSTPEGNQVSNGQWVSMTNTITIGTNYDAAITAGISQELLIWFRTPDSSSDNIYIDNMTLVEVTDTDNDGIYDAADDFVNDASRDEDADNDGIANNVYQLDNGQRVDGDNGYIVIASLSDLDDIDASVGLDTDGDSVADDIWSVESDGSVTVDSNGNKVLAADQSTADNDDDNDNVSDEYDALPLDSTSYIDQNSNGVGDELDVTNGVDVDGDGETTADAMPYNSYFTETYSVPASTDNSLGENLIVNGHFENSDLQGWAPQTAQGTASITLFEAVDANASAANDPQDSMVAWVTHVNGVAATIKQTISADVNTDGTPELIPGRTYQWSANLWLPANASSVNFVYKYKVSQEAYGASVVLDDAGQGLAVTETWTRITVPFTLGQDFVDGLEVWFKLSGADNFKVDDVSLVELTDSDSDGYVDSKDAFINDATANTDSDKDGIADNYYELDANGVRTGNLSTTLVADALPNDLTETLDTDNDGTGNNADTDDDNDGVDDVADAFPLDGSESVDTDGDLIGNNTDPDDDGDGVNDENDGYPLDNTKWDITDGDNDGWLTEVDPDDTDASIPGTTFVDTDGDGFADVGGLSEDTDDDNDGYTDVDELADGSDPLDNQSLPLDTDGDMSPDVVDTDDDNDSVLDTADAFSTDATEWLDTDNDGTGDFADALPLDATESVDSDNDYVGDNTDAFPADAREWQDLNSNSIGDNADRLFGEISLIANGNFEDLNANLNVDAAWSPQTTDEEVTAVTIEQEAERGHYVTVSNRPTSFVSAKIQVPELVAGGTYKLTAMLKSSSFVSFACSQCILKQEDVDGNTVESLKSGQINGYEVASNGDWVAYETTFTIPALPQTDVPQLWVRVGNADGGIDLSFDDVALVALDTNRQLKLASRAANDSTYTSDDANNYWTADNLNGNKLDVMRTSATEGFGSSDNVSLRPQATFTEIDVAIATDGWRYATEAELTELVAFYANDSQAYLDISGGEWSADQSQEHTVLVVPVANSTGDNRDVNAVEITANGIGVVHPLTTLDLSDIRYVAVVVRDVDTDADGVFDNQDVFPLDATEQADMDGDLKGDNSDDDIDGDGYLNTDEVDGAAARDANATPADMDGDFIPDTRDADKDGDSYDAFEEDGTTVLDVFPNDPTEWFDTDNDGTGDNTDTDIDGDGYSNDVEKQVGSSETDGSITPSDYDQDFIPNMLDDDDVYDGVNDLAADGTQLDAFHFNTAADTDTDGDGVADVYYELDENGVRTGELSTTQVADIDADGDLEIDNAVITVTAPADVTVEASGATSVVTLGVASYTDSSGLTVLSESITSDAPASFAVGTQTVTWTVNLTLDNNGESLTSSATASQTVVVEDTTAAVFDTLPSINLVADVSGNADVTLTAPMAIDVVDGDVTATTDFADGSYTAGDYTVTWTAVDSEQNVSTATQTVSIAVGYSGSLISDSTSFANVAGDDFYHIYDLNGENLQVMRLSVSDDVAGVNADSAAVDAWLLDNSSWSSATAAQLNGLVYFFESDAVAFGQFNGWGAGQQWTALGTDNGAVVALSVNDSGFVDVDSAAGVDSNAADAAVLLVRAFVDSDDDGIHDADDAFPNDATETLDSDLDGVGDNADAFPLDETETLDSDLDGVGDNADAFPLDATETVDSDLDGVGDNADAFPNDGTETSDVDNDGIGDNTDDFNDITGEFVVFYFKIDTAASVSVLPTVEATGAQTPVSLVQPVLNDVASGISPVFSNNSASVSGDNGFTVGDYNVLWTVSHANYSRTFVQSVSVVDTTAPVLSAQDIAVEATGELTAVNAVATAVDLVDGDVVVESMQMLNTA
jgi:hypothetical protein